MNVDLQKSAGTNHVRLTIDIDGLAYTIAFRSGGVADIPMTTTAAAGGGLTHEGMYDAWAVEGEVTVSRDMAKWLVEAYHGRSNAKTTSAVYELHSTVENMIIKHQFDNVCVSSLPNLNIDSLGAEVTMQIGFSLNGYVATEVIDAKAN